MGPRFPRVFALALVLLAGRAAPGDEVAEALKSLAADDIATGAALIEVLAKAGTEEAAARIADFGTATRHVRLIHEAGKALAGAGNAVAQVRRLQESLGKEPTRLARVAILASYVPGPEALKVLSELASDPRDRVAVHGIRGLRGRPPADVRPILLRLLSSKHEDIAAAAAVGLGDLPSDADTNEALFKVVSKGGLLAGFSTHALARIEGTEAYGDRAFRMLGKRARDESFHALAKLALWKSKDPGKEELEEAFQSAADEVREVACDLIGLRRLPGHEKRLLVIATGDKSWRTRVAAWLALRRAGIRGVTDEVHDLIRGKQEPSYWAIQCAAAWPDEALVDVLREAALDTEDPVRRTLAQIALSKHAAGVKATRTFYLDTWSRSRGTSKGQAALVGLGHLKENESFEALVGLLGGEKKKEHRISVLKGLQKLTGHYYAPDPALWRKWFQAVGGKVPQAEAKFDRRKSRALAAQVQGLGLSAESEAAVERGLSWLVRHQDLSGTWSDGYQRNCLVEGACSSKVEYRHRDLAFTGLALLALEGAGYFHLEGPYADVVRAGFANLFAQSEYDSQHGLEEEGFCYESGIVCSAVCDAYVQTNDPSLGLAGQRIVDYLAKIQLPGRIWRYTPRDANGDTSVLSWVLMACVCARDAGLDVPEQILVGAEVWLDRACDPVPPDTFEIFSADQFGAGARYALDVSADEKGKAREFKLRTYYQPPKSYTTSMPAIGLVSRVWLGWTRAHPFCVGSANQILGEVPKYNEGLLKAWASYPYTWYYGSVAMHQMGGRHWSRWRDECLADLLRNAVRRGCADGSWATPSREPGWADAGAVYTTAMAVLALESFYRFRPYLSRFEPPAPK